MYLYILKVSFLDVLSELMLQNQSESKVQDVSPPAVGLRAAARPEPQQEGHRDLPREGNMARRTSAWHQGTHHPSQGQKGMEQEGAGSGWDAAIFAKEGLLNTCDTLSMSVMVTKIN